MFDRFSQRARKVMGFSRQEAQRLRHDFIATEHLLLGLIREGTGVAIAALRNLDVDPDSVRREVETVAGTGERSGDTLPFTPRARKVLELSWEEASDLGHTYIGTEHLLLGLLRDDGGIGGRVLRQRGVTLERVREEVLEILGPEPSEDVGVQRSVAEQVTSESFLRVTAARIRAEVRAAEAAHDPTVVDRLRGNVALLFAACACDRPGALARILAGLGVSEADLLSALEREVRRVGEDRPGGASDERANAP